MLCKECIAAHTNPAAGIMRPSPAQPNKNCFQQERPGASVASDATGSHHYLPHRARKDFDLGERSCSTVCSFVVMFVGLGLVSVGLAGLVESCRGRGGLVARLALK